MRSGGKQGASVLGQGARGEFEDEVLLPPGCRFEVMGVLPQGPDLTIIQLKELPSREWIIDLRTLATSNTTAAPATPPVAPSPSTSSTPAVPDLMGLITQVQALGFSSDQVLEGVKHGQTADEVANWILNQPTSAPAPAPGACGAKGILLLQSEFAEWSCCLFCFLHAHVLSCAKTGGGLM